MSKVIIKYSNSDIEIMQKNKRTPSALKNEIQNKMIELASAPVVKRCKKICTKKECHYEIPPEAIENLQILADNDGISLTKYITKRIVNPILNGFYNAV